MKKINIIFCIILCISIMIAVAAPTFALQTANESNACDILLSECTAPYNSEDIPEIPAEAVLIDSKIKNVQGIIYYVDTYENTIVLESRELYSGQIQTDYQTTYYRVLRETGDRYNATNYSTTGSKWDLTCSALFSVTVYYTDSSIGGILYRQITSAEGYCSVVDPQVSLYSHNILVGECGRDANYNFIDKRKTYYIGSLSSSWTRTISSDFPAIRKTAGMQGVRYTVKLQRCTGTIWNDSITIDLLDTAFTF